MPAALILGAVQAGMAMYSIIKSNQEKKAAREKMETYEVSPEIKDFYGMAKSDVSSTSGISKELIKESRQQAANLASPQFAASGADALGAASRASKGYTSSLDRIMKFEQADRGSRLNRLATAANLMAGERAKETASINELFGMDYAQAGAHEQAGVKSLGGAGGALGDYFMSDEYGESKRLKMEAYEKELDRLEALEN